MSLFKIVATLFLLYPQIVSSKSAVALYTPSHSPCPDGFSLYRPVGISNQTLSEGESAYVSSRKNHVLPEAWKSYLSNVEGTNVSLPGYVSSILSGANGTEVYPTLGIATSGGGWRAAIFGGGVLNALDGRNVSSSRNGAGGLLQAATYLTGLSGGAWLVTSMMQANFPVIHDLVFGTSGGGQSSRFGGWLPQYSLATPSDDLVTDVAYLAGLVADIQGKHLAGFPITIADIWAGNLARHFLNGTNGANFYDFTKAHGAGLTLSGVAKTATFASFNEPFPIVIADSKSNGGNKSNILVGGQIPLTNPIYEFNVYEMGSYDPTLAAFAQTKYMGTTNGSTCVTGFDQLSFVQATSSDVFTSYNTTNLTAILQLLDPIIDLTLLEPNIELDAAVYPNPFYGVNKGTYIDSDETYLNLVDGGFNTESIPLQPLLVQARGVEVILAIDATADVDGYAAGSSLIASQTRTTFFPSAYSFPPVPSSVDDFIEKNLTSRPTFFGCNSSSPTPLIIYVPNGAPLPGQPPLTNTSSDQLEYSLMEVQGMLDQTFDMATLRGVDDDWPACLACAVVDRARVMLGAIRSGVCETCMKEYCWS
ncbi:FabD/lysophospholipase-like protein [Gloeophyllum trabeum ATCC 11539]|uniref:Lysophospholipase n=1 Tax=Gloeophyllum trabeum (strain ATCC 11539 / FP-39264 / Madison 617) TaxID=670483 RepID=S7RV09_GLOTA|nr:FabD/lysophospholipase-like protein [Gloeophyllum trabeum ATCC 11539]EPQ57044.1 FabD/lysophospholipase-like protein [Gloeophyllum trabeum ATCC 11539]